MKVRTVPVPSQPLEDYLKNKYEDLSVRQLSTQIKAASLDLINDLPERIKKRFGTIVVEMINSRVSSLSPDSELYGKYLSFQVYGTVILNDHKHSSCKMFIATFFWDGYNVTYHCIDSLEK